MAVDADAVSRAVAAHLDAFVPDDAVVLTYLPMPGEVDPGLPARDRVLLVTRTPERGVLTVHRADAARELHPYGFEQPAAGEPTWDAPIDVALVPGVAFDRSGGRLGHGAGYFDRFLASREIPVRVGVTADARLVDRLPIEDHDIPMTHVVTESGVARA